MTVTENSPNTSIAIIGGGFGGMCAAIQLQKKFQIGPLTNSNHDQNISFTIFDENSDFGGTWLVNKYPGCASEAAIHLYSFSFEPNPNWTKIYPSQQEIHEYIVNVAKKHNLYKRARFSTQVKSVDWLENESQWEIHIFDKISGCDDFLRFKYVICATGPLRLPNKPAEFSSFQGPLFHSSEWDDSIDLRDKRVGVVGCGASALQIIPTIAPLVKELHSFQRSPSWVMPKPMEWRVPFLIRKLWTVTPLLLWAFRIFLFFMYDLWFQAFYTDSFLHRLGISASRWHLRRGLKGNKNLVLSLKPNYKFGCKRVCPANKYYPAFTLPNVKIHRGEIAKVEENRIKIANGNENNKWQELDVLILATGFRVQDAWAPLKVRPSKDGVDMAPTVKATEFGHYHGIVTNSLPNFFIVVGPNTGVGHSSLVFMIECQVNFLVELIRQTEKKDAKNVVVKKAVQEKWMAKIRNDLKSIVWQNSSCVNTGGWVRNTDGVANALWVKNCAWYWWDTRTVNTKDFEFTT